MSERRVFTSNGYEVTWPRGTEEVELEAKTSYGSYCLYLNADDLRMMLDRIERGKK